MATYNANQLVRLSDTDEFVLDPSEDVRGRKVKDSDGSDLGKVQDLLIDQEDNKVRALIVDHGHFLEKTTSLIPVDAIYRVTADEVHITQNKEKISGSSVYDPTLVYDADYYFGVYDYYGYSPYWDDDYIYPAYPFYV